MNGWGRVFIFFSLVTWTWEHIIAPIHCTISPTLVGLDNVDAKARWDLRGSLSRRNLSLHREKSSGCKESYLWIPNTIIPYQQSPYSLPLLHMSDLVPQTWNLIRSRRQSRVRFKRNPFLTSSASVFYGARPK